MGRIKVLWGAVLISFVILISGCETLKGAAAGAKKDWESAKNIDNWIRQNLW